jgi:hypothetical protein
MPGFIVETKTGKRGRTSKGQAANGNKIPVALIDDKGNPTGEKILCDPATLTIKGFWD